MPKADWHPLVSLAPASQLPLLHSPHSRSPLPPTHARAGTARFMAPEVLDARARGSHVADPTGDAGQRADCYSVGLVAWLVLTGKLLGPHPGPGVVFPADADVPPELMTPKFKPFVDLVRALLHYHPAMRWTMIQVPARARARACVSVCVRAC